MVRQAQAAPAAEGLIARVAGFSASCLQRSRTGCTGSRGGRYRHRPARTEPCARTRPRVIAPWAAASRWTAMAATMDRPAPAPQGRRAAGAGAGALRRRLRRRPYRHVGYVTSPYAHAKILAIDVSAAEALPG